MKLFKLQSAMEYLMTYSWAILILSIVLVIFFAIVTPPPVNSCVFPAGFYCQNLFLASNGMATVNIQQISTTAINVTAYGCNTNQTIAHMQKVFNPPSNQIKMQIAANFTFSVFCYAGTSISSGNPGSQFFGYFILNYTNLNSGFPQTITGQIATQVQ